MFRISRRLDYGLQLMIALAVDTDNKAQSTASLSEKLQIPLPFLHQIGHTLMQAGMIKATPGPRGGLRLNQPAETITVLQIVETLEGKVVVNPCPEGEDDCDGNGSQVVWNGLQERILGYLDNFQLNQLVASAQTLPLFAVSMPEAVKKNG
jgi:Rrf2 family protein